jgi:multidrug efflux pump subunit AcrA (membrane-fusion protein)
MTMHSPSRGSSRRGPVRAGALLIASLVVGACASPPAPTGQLRAAQQAIDDAERAQAARHAPTELSEARTKLASANAAVEEREMDRAARLAEEARVEAELAAARTAAAKALAANDEIRRGTRALEEELQRNTGGTP